MEAPENLGSSLKSIISRYGEMKKSPLDLIDAEGEAASFSKVDEALQSIGISIKTSSNQMRDFDDVILELSSKWASLDRNTQRYWNCLVA